MLALSIINLIWITFLVVTNIIQHDWRYILFGKYQNKKEMSFKTFGSNDSQEHL